jgi:hypothetical protein
MRRRSYVHRGELEFNRLTRIRNYYSTEHGFPIEGIRMADMNVAFFTKRSRTALRVLGFQAILFVSTQIGFATQNVNIATVAGDGQKGYAGDGASALQAELSGPSGIAFDGAGGFYFADTNNHRIRHVDASGVITTVAGNGTAGFTGDGGSALLSEISSPSSVSSDGAGGFLIADAGNERIRRVDAGGTITTVAGNGRYGFLGDGGPAVNAQLNYPAEVSPDGSGGYYIADEFNNCVRRVDAGGIITTVAGNEVNGFAGDGGPATDARLNYPTGVASDGAGGFYIADSSNERIRRVDAHGIITTVAGNGRYGFSGDGGPAVNAQLNYPAEVAANGAGGFFVADSSNERIRQVDANGVITTVAGDGHGGFAGDGGPATDARLDSPTGMAIDGTGGILISDTGNARIRYFPLGNGISGDINGDGAVNVQDVTLLLHFAIGLQTPNAVQQAAADLNKDGRIDVLDVSLDIQKAVGL